ncbi:MAG: tetratricopeptide repeat protein [Acidobacteriaceae bacterium]
MNRPRFLSLVSLLIVLAVCAFGQARRPTSGNTGNTNNTNTNTPGRPVMNIPDTTSRGRESQLEIQITGEDSRPLPIQVLVELSAIGGGVIQQNYTDMDGRVRFTAIPTGQTYQIKVSGAGIETTQTSMDLFQGENFHHQMVAVKLAEGKNNLPGGLVSASMLNVPVKARREFDKGMELMRKEKWADAKKHLEKATQEYPNFDWAYNNIGVVDMQMKDEAGAQEAFARAVAINSKNPDATRNLARLKLKGDDFQGAKTLLLDSVTAKPGDPETLALLAYAQYRTKDFEQALTNAEKVHTDKSDKYPLAHLIAASIRESRGDRAGAQKQYEMYLKEAPDGPQAQIAKDGLARVGVQAKN